MAVQVRPAMFGLLYSVVAIYTITTTLLQHGLVAFAWAVSEMPRAGLEQPTHTSRSHQESRVPDKNNRPNCKWQSHGIRKHLSLLGGSELAVSTFKVVSFAILSVCSTTTAQEGFKDTQPIPTIDAKPFPSESLNRPPAANSAWFTIPLPNLLLLAATFLGTAWILLRKRQYENPQHRSWLWLMAFTTSIAWWVISAIAGKPHYDKNSSSNNNNNNNKTNNDADDDGGKSLSISLWLFFFAIYAAKSYRAARHGYQFILTSLMGGIVATVLLAAYCEHVVDDLRYRGRGMQGFAVQALAVGPFALTVWVWIVTSVGHSIESQQHRGGGGEPGTELNSLSDEG